MTYSFHSSPARLRLETAIPAPPQPQPLTVMRDVRSYEADLIAAIDALARHAAEEARKNEGLARVLVVKPKAIIAEVCAAHGFEVWQVKPGSRVQNLVRCRQEIAYRLRVETNLSSPEIGRVMGGFDHTTILHGIHQHAERHHLPLPKGMKARKKRPSTRKVAAHCDGGSNALAGEA